MENIISENQTSVPAEATKAVTAKKTTPKFIIKDEQSGEKIKSIAEVVGFIGSIIALISCFIVWFQTSSIVGFIVGLLIAIGGLFVSYFMVLLSYGYVNMITNAIEQTNILKRLEAQNLNGFLERADLKTEKPIDTDEPKNSDKKSLYMNPDEDDEIEEYEYTLYSLDSKPAENAKKESEWPLVGVIDSRMRRVAHFAERSKHGIICPICNRKQSSELDSCYFCDCRFIYDDEQPKSHEDEILDRLRHLTAK